MMNILLVEDEPLILRSLAGTIKSFQQNYQIVGSAYNGQEAIDLLSKKGNQIDVVITDIHIPVIDGLELIEHINQHFPHILCMILTGFSDFSYAKRAIQLRVFAYLLKPIDENEIQEHLKKAYEQKCLEGKMCIRDSNKTQHSRQIKQRSKKALSLYRVIQNQR